MYSAYEKEFYAIIQDWKKWSHYLVPQEFELYSNKQSLKFISRQEKLNQRHAKWVEFMQNGFEHLKDMYHDDADFKEAYEACANPVLRDMSQWTKYLIQEGLLFKGNQLCIPKCSMRDNLLKEKHSGGLDGHFGHDKTCA